MSFYAIGIDPTQTYTATQLQQSGKGFALGTRGLASNGKEYVFVQADGAITGAGYICIITEAYQADMADLTNSATARGDLCGVPEVAFADDEFGWLQVKGPCLLQVAVASANVRLNTTATSGQLDDDGGAGSEEILGCFLTAARVGSAGTSAAILNYPSVGATL